MNDLRLVWVHISGRRKKQFFLLLVLMIVASLLETISVGAVLPFLGALTSPELIFNHQLMSPIISFLQLKSPDELLVPLTVLFILAVVISGIIKLILLYTLTRFSFMTGAEISDKIYQKTLYQEFPVHLSRNSSEVINGIVKKTQFVIGYVFVPFLQLISAIILLIGIMSILLSVNFKISFATLSGLSIIYFAVVINRRHKLLLNSEIIAAKSNQMIKILQEGMGAIRDVLFEAKQEFYAKLYLKADYPFRLAEGNNHFISASPKFAIEALGMALIALIAYYIALDDSSFSSHIPLLGILIMGAQKMLPAVQQCFASIARIKGAQSSLKDVIILLNQKIPEDTSIIQSKKIPFLKELSVENLSFSYSGSDPMLFQNVNLSFPRGSKTGFVGKTGSGKSTLVDILMGLLFPTSGEIRVDNQLINLENRKSWQAHIAHVPQNIFLTDSSIESNIAFGIPKEKINSQLVIEVAIKAQLHNLINQWPEKYKTIIGEEGVRLSGGQRQRIGIARALYKKSDLIVFDEATSSLDNETEKEVMKTIESLEDVTILIIAHRISTLRNCNQIVEFTGNEIRTGTFNDMFHKFDKSL